VSHVLFYENLEDIVGEIATDGERIGYGKVLHRKRSLYVRDYNISAWRLLSGPKKQAVNCFKVTLCFCCNNSETKISRHT
jgi:hypothetical protein